METEHGQWFITGFICPHRVRIQTKVKVKGFENYSQEKFDRPDRSNHEPNSIDAQSLAVTRHIQVIIVPRHGITRTIMCLPSPNRANEPKPRNKLQKRPPAPAPKKTIPQQRKSVQVPTRAPVVRGASALPPARVTTSNIPQTARPMFQQAVIQRPMIQQPVIQEPVVRKPVVRKPVAQQAVAQQAVAQQAVAQQAVAQQAVVQQAVVQQAVVQQPSRAATAPAAMSDQVLQVAMCLPPFEIDFANSEKSLAQQPVVQQPIRAATAPAAMSDQSWPGGMFLSPYEAAHAKDNDLDRNLKRKNSTKTEVIELTDEEGDFLESDIDGYVSEVSETKAHVKRRGTRKKPVRI
ncbi:hypothetical protein B0T20DRAFT_151140 [Sordaria brevicollis]|uniref:Uncharacterized protein n=1 Tax=Sordaria brevicollis TaxID=83679 RepID=A0AAE0UE05_SORBR|nr:hypothetical protein B0T20DRAFT_151140 [Sordaria brevicollis]